MKRELSSFDEDEGVYLPTSNEKFHDLYFNLSLEFT